MTKRVQPLTRLVFRDRFWQMVIVVLAASSCLPIVPVQIVDSAGGAGLRAWAPLHESYTVLFLDPGPLVVTVVVLHLIAGFTFSYTLARIIWRTSVAV